MENQMTEGLEVQEQEIETRESIVENAVADVELQGKLEDLAATEGDLTAESLRASLGDVAEGLSDGRVGQGAKG
jgi:hypothetical protein